MSVLFAVRGPCQRICTRCLNRRSGQSSISTLYRSSIHTKRKLHGSIVPDNDVQKHMPIHAQSSFNDYFSANDSLDRGWLKNGLLAAFRTSIETTKTRPAETEVTKLQDDMKGPVSSQDDFKLPQAPQEDSTAVTSASAVEPEAELLPHRRRLLRKAKAEKDAREVQDSQNPGEAQLPLDASSRLATTAESLPKTATLRRRIATYLSLSKPRLSFLIILTTTSAYSLYPIPEILSSTASAVDATTTLSTSTLTLLFLTTGTFLSCASANTFNMLFEPKYDAMMTRTRNRPLVRKLITPRAALIFALLCGSTGLMLLNFGTNPTVAALSGLNIFLYGFVYTPMKRLSAANTWVGAIVGGIPPLMGWAAAAGQAATSEHHSWKDLLFSEDSIGGWMLAALLFAWQFPHFNSLSHTIRDDYKRAGHKMLCWVNPARNARVALRYSIAMFPICAGLYWAGIVNQGFLAISTVCNAWMTREAIRFWKYQGANGSARGLFWASVWQLPLVLVGALVCKAGIWDGFFRKDIPSIYEVDVDEIIADGESLGMDSAQASTQAQDNHRSFNMAMLGFKRPS